MMAVRDGPTDDGGPDKAGTASNNEFHFGSKNLPASGPRPAFTTCLLAADGLH